MKIGIIGAGRVGCSMGKYLADRGKTVTGFYSQTYESAAAAAEFTGTDCFQTMEELVSLSDTLWIAVPDDEIGAVWDCMKEMSIDGRIICHFSGSLSSDVFNGIDGKKAYGASIHPMLAFRDKFSSYGQLNNCFFTMEGSAYALERMEGLLGELGNPYRLIRAQDKAKYHCAASVLSNEVLALLDLGFGLLEQCGFTKEEAIYAAAALVKGNVENVLANGTLSSMTGPVLRGDVSTVEKHLEVLSGEEREVYRLLARRLLEMAQRRQEQKLEERRLERRQEENPEKGRLERRQEENLEKRRLERCQEEFPGMNPEELPLEKLPGNAVGRAQGNEKVKQGKLQENYRRMHEILK